MISSSWWQENPPCCWEMRKTTQPHAGMQRVLLDGGCCHCWCPYLSLWPYRFMFDNLDLILWLSPFILFCFFLCYFIYLFPYLFDILHDFHLIICLSGLAPWKNRRLFFTVWKVESVKLKCWPPTEGPRQESFCSFLASGISQQSLEVFSSPISASSPFGVLCMYFSVPSWKDTSD